MRKRAAIARDTAAGMLRATRAGARNTTLPLWMYVRGESAPAAANSSTSAAIGSGFLPPTLIPRSSATWLGITCLLITRPACSSRDLPPHCASCLLIARAASSSRDLPRHHALGLPSDRAQLGLARRDALGVLGPVGGAQVLPQPGREPDAVRCVQHGEDRPDGRDRAGAELAADAHRLR